MWGIPLFDNLHIEVSNLIKEAKIKYARIQNRLAVIGAGFRDKCEGRHGAISVSDTTDAA